MPPGADRIIAFSPPGAIGLVARDAIVHLRFDEVESTQRPRDAAGTLTDLDVMPTLAMPAVADGATGRARVFSPALMTGLVAQDLVSGTSLLTRDLTIQVIAWFQPVMVPGEPDAATLLMRGCDSETTMEGCAYGLQLAPVPGSSAWALTLVWKDVAGAGVAAPGGAFEVPQGFTLLTVTRRWVSPTETVVRYYIGDQLIGDVTAGGSIGGATTDRMSIGVWLTEAGPRMAFPGLIDELLILDHEITREEIEATWLRITRYQPLGYQLFREMHDPGFPISNDPGSDVQLETRMIGHGLGYAAAQGENLRANIMPDRAYGSILERWEQIVRVTPQPGQDLDTRRARVIARMRQRRGCSIDGLKDALEGLVATDVDNLEFLAFDNTIRDDFSAGIQVMRWDVTPAGSYSLVSGAARAVLGAGTYLMNGTTRDWATMATAVGGDGREAHLIAKMVMNVPIGTSQGGIWFGDLGRGNYILLGVPCATGDVVVETFIANVSQGVVVCDHLTSSPTYLHLYQRADGIWKVEYRSGDPSTFTAWAGNFSLPAGVQWAGCYVRSTDALVVGTEWSFDDVILRTPYGTRPFNAYVYRPPGFPGTVDIEGVHSVIRAIKHAYAWGTIITSKNLLCDMVFGCDRGPMGGI